MGGWGPKGEAGAPRVREGGGEAGGLGASVSGGEIYAPAGTRTGDLGLEDPEGEVETRAPHPTQPQPPAGAGFCGESLGSASGRSLTEACI